MKKLKELGFDGIEGSAPGMDVGGIRKACEEVGLPMHGVVYNKHWNKRLSSPDKAVRDEGRTGLEAAIRESKAVGGSSVLLVPGAVRGPNETHEQVWERSITEIRKVIPLASKLGIHVLIETVWNGFCYKPEQFRVTSTKLTTHGYRRITTSATCRNSRLATSGFASSATAT